MKFILILGFVTISAGIKIKSKTNEITQQNTDLFKYSPNDEYTLPEDIDDTDSKPPSSFQGDVKIAKTLTMQNINQGKGKFKYSLQTQNGIELNQVGRLKDDKTFVVSGSYSYTGADGKRYRVRYTADELGYHPITELDIDIPEIIGDAIGNKGFQFLNQNLDSADRGNGQIGDDFSYNNGGNAGTIGSHDATAQGYAYDAPDGSSLYLPPFRPDETPSKLYIPGY